MKNIVILVCLILLPCSVSAKLPESKATIENAKLVSQEGWKVASKPLEVFIKQEGATFIASFLEVAAQPYEEVFQKNASTSIEKIPKIHLTVTENYFALAYAKYLESQSKTEEALQIYLSILQGLKEANLNGAHLFGVIYRISIERLTTRSLQESLSNTIYTMKQKEKLQDFLKNNLLFKADIFYEALEDNRAYLKKMCQGSLVDNSAIWIYHKDLDLILDKNDHSQAVYEKICALLDQKQKKFNEDLRYITNQQENDNFQRSISKQKKTFNTWLQNLKSKSPNEIKKLKFDPNIFIDGVSNILYYESIHSRLSTVKLDILQNIEFNQKLLGVLQLNDKNNNDKN